MTNGYEAGNLTSESRKQECNSESYRAVCGMNCATPRDSPRILPKHSTGIQGSYDTHCTLLGIE